MGNCCHTNIEPSLNFEIYSKTTSNVTNSPSPYPGKYSKFFHLKYRFDKEEPSATQPPVCETNLIKDSIHLLNDRLTKKDKSDNYDELNPKDYEELFKVMSKNLKSYCWKDLRKFELDFLNCRNIDDKTFWLLSLKVLKQLNKLDHLSLSLGSCLVISDEALKTLGLELRSLNNLKKLDLVFRFCCTIGNEGIKALLFCITRNLSSLEHLSIDFQGDYYRVFPENLVAIIPDINRYLVNLKWLMLGLDGCYINDEWLQKIWHHNCAYSTNIEHLTLNFVGKPVISSKGLEILASAINNSYKKLRTLSLFFSGDSINDEGLICLVGESGLNLPHLEELQLSFILCDFTAKGLENFGCQVGKYLPGLERFDFSFCKEDYSGSPEDGLIDLAVELCRNLIRLSSLCFRLVNLNNFGDSQLEIIMTKILESSQSLKELKLCFAGCECIKDRGVIKLLPILTGSKSKSRKIKLSFSQCQVSKRTEDEMNKGLRSVPNVSINIS